MDGVSCILIKIQECGKGQECDTWASTDKPANEAAWEVQQPSNYYSQISLACCHELFHVKSSLGLSIVMCNFETLIPFPEQVINAQLLKVLSSHGFH